MRKLQSSRFGFCIFLMSSLIPKVPKNK
ncbi:MAG: hypothetical protein ACRBF0_07675 [Calditrichia bacterium]